jgi:four helix bundle protein
MTEDGFKHRTKKYALRIIRLVDALPNGQSASTIGRQLLRAGTSVGANYRAACRGQSTAETLAKLSIVEEEADESLYWLELLAEADLVSPDRLHPLMTEGNQIVAMTVASIKTLRENQ